jgi:hypothetical protein
MTPQRLPPEASGSYVLAVDSTAYACKQFTSNAGVLFSGPSDVTCLGRPIQRNTPTQPVPKGTTVRVISIQTQGLIDAQGELAKLAVGTGEGVEMYAQWPELRDLLERLPR